MRTMETFNIKKSTPFTKSLHFAWNLFQFGSSVWFAYYASGNTMRKLLSSQLLKLNV